MLQRRSLINFLAAKDNWRRNGSVGGGGHGAITENPCKALDTESISTNAYGFAASVRAGGSRRVNSRQHFRASRSSQARFI